MHLRYAILYTLDSIGPIRRCPYFRMVQNVPATPQLSISMIEDCTSLLLPPALPNLRKAMAGEGCRTGGWLARHQRDMPHAPPVRWLVRRERYGQLRLQALEAQVPVVQSLFLVLSALVSG